MPVISISSELFGTSSDEYKKNNLQTTLDYKMYDQNKLNF